MVLLGNVEVMERLLDETFVDAELFSGEFYGTFLTLNLYRLTRELQMAMEFLPGVERFLALETRSVSWTLLIKMLMEFENIVFFAFSILI